MTSDSSTILTRKLLTLWPQKGGIGKSFVATLAFDYLRERGVRVKAFDLDHANSTFQRYVPKAEFIDTDIDTDKLGVLDQLVQALTDGDAEMALADNRASGGDKLEYYFEENRLVELQTEMGVAMVFVIVVVDDKDAISQIAELVERYGDRVRWLVARNFKDGPKLSLFEQGNTRKKLLAHGAVEIDVPCLAEVTRNRLQLANLTVAAGRTAEQLHLLDRSRCVRFHEKMAAEFAKAERLLFS
jgi:hypothetical protein